jgi:hypothetical protein
MSCGHGGRREGAGRPQGALNHRDTRFGTLRASRAREYGEVARGLDPRPRRCALVIHDGHPRKSWIAPYGRPTPSNEPVEDQAPPSPFPEVFVARTSHPPPGSKNIASKRVVPSASTGNKPRCLSSAGISRHHCVSRPSLRFSPPGFGHRPFTRTSMYSRGAVLSPVRMLPRGARITILGDGTPRRRPGRSALIYRLQMIR